MANIKHLTSALRLTLSLGTVDGKSVTKTVSVSKIGAAAGAETLNALVGALGDLLEHPVASVKKYDTGLLEVE
ncbi:hypothetical protein SDC9_173987 [bioreactor metagenome]|uniref:DUF1659 domain-containing protein n=1 Tax=bioreactor metagenome TaxID=1076179 RepID=A0A645GL13_9ZZZZ